MLPNTAAPDQPVTKNHKRLNQEQIAAWHALSKELPTFSGRPEEWPLFLSVFDETTTACNFSDQENLSRLQRCLKGKALEAVRFLCYLVARYGLFTRKTHLQH